MNAWTFAQKSFVHNWRVNLAVILGAAIATAVLTGALIVGDSVKGSLLDLTIERLGKIDEIILTDRFFREELASEVQSATDFQAHYRNAVPAIVLPTTSAEHIAEAGTSRASSVTLVGCDPRFWEQDPNSSAVDHSLDGQSIIVNEPLASELNVKVGDSLTIRLPKVQNMAADSTLADKSDISETMAGLRVTKIIPATGLGRFSLNPSQRLPFCAFVSLDTAQDAVNQNGRVNSILICSDRVGQPPPPEAHSGLLKSLQPSLEDVGLTLQAIDLNYYDEKTETQKVEHQYLSLSTDRMMFVDPASDAIKSRLNDVIVQPVFTYLANSIATTDGSIDIPYSTITAIDSIPSIGPLFDQDGNSLNQLGDDEIVLNTWTADDLSASIGDHVTVSYFDPETTHGNTTEHSATFRVAAIAPLVKPLLPYTRRKPARYVDPPAWTNDPDLTPTVPGVTDQASIDDWDPPFPFDYKLIQARKPKDDDYWADYRTTPKAFVSFSTGNRLWGSRFGSVTSFRIDAGRTTLAALKDRVESAVADNVTAFGFQVIESKRLGVDAAQGTTPFSVLFMFFSFFIVTAAVLLLALLFRLSVEQRATENGLLLSVGLDHRTVGKLILLEGICIATVAAIIGMVLGIGYAALMITGLKTLWVEAVVTPFLDIHFTYTSLLVGSLLGITTTCLTIFITLWGLRKVPARQLLAGNVESYSHGRQRNRRSWTRYMPIGFAIIAAICGMLGLFLSGEAQAGAFFGTGASILAAGLLLVRSALLKSGGAAAAVAPSRFNDSILAFRNAARNPSRSVMTIGLMSAACFLIIAISAFRLAPSDEGSGGFSIVAYSELPIFDDLNNSDVRAKLFGTAADTFANSTILCLRLQDGEDASCRNLYQAQRPRIIGVPSTMIEHFNQAKASFKFAGSATEDANPWTVLSQETPVGEPIPVVLDKNTAMYSQHLYRGIGEEFERDYGGGQVIRFRVAGLLSNSILQGSFLVSEADLRRLFPNVGGYRYFLIQSPIVDAAKLVLEDTFENEGFDATDSRDLLKDLLAVQNTYLSTFQSLGGLGLLLGTFGLMAVQLRNVWQRRGEIALLRATGFDQSRVGRIIMLEHALLLFSGLGLGTVAAMLTVLPHILIGGATVPLAATVYMLVLIVGVGLVTGIVAVRGSARLPLLATLRGT